MAPSAVVSNVPGVGVGERVFPPQAGLTFVSWVCIDQYSDTTEDQHPVRLLTIMRQFRGGSEKIPNVPCLSISISAKDRMLVVSLVDLFNPLHPNISVQILHIVLYTFPKVLPRRICLTIKSFLTLRSFPLIS